MEANEPVVVYVNKSERNPQQASLKTLSGDHARKPHFSGCVRSYSYSYYVLSEYFLPQSRKLQFFGAAPNELVGTHAYSCSAPCTAPIPHW